MRFYIWSANVMTYKVRKYIMQVDRVSRAKTRNFTLSIKMNWKIEYWRKKEQNNNRIHKCNIKKIHDKRELTRDKKKR